MNARLAREYYIEKNIPKNNIDIIYETIENAVMSGYPTVFIKDFNISESEKMQLEADGYLVVTTYLVGFQIRWYESDENYYKYMLESMKKSESIETSPEIIEKYTKMQGF